MARPAQSNSPAAFRVAAAALAGVPVGFAAGAILGGQLLAASPPAEAGRLVLACALFGALFVGATLALSAFLLAPKPARIVTIVAGACSFAVAIYMVRAFVVDRMAQADALDAALQAMPRFELSLTVDEPARPPFSSLVYDSLDRSYRALRPGGWRCTGRGSRAHALALHQALRHVGPDTGEGCARRVSWRIDQGELMQGCADGDQALFAAADAMVDSTERRSSCRRSSEPLAGLPSRPQPHLDGN